MASHYHLSSGREGIYSFPGLGVGASEGNQAFGLVAAHLKAAHASGQLPSATAFVDGLTAADLLPLTSVGIQGETLSDTGASKTCAQTKGRQRVPGRVVSQEELEKVPFDRTACAGGCSCVLPVPPFHDLPK